MHLRLFACLVHHFNCIFRLRKFSAFETTYLFSFKPFLHILLHNSFSFQPLSFSLFLSFCFCFFSLKIKQEKRAPSAQLIPKNQKRSCYRDFGSTQTGTSDNHYLISSYIAARCQLTSYQHEIYITMTFRNWSEKKNDEHGYIVIMQMFWMLLSYSEFKLFFRTKFCLRRIIFKVTRQQLNSICGNINLKILAVRYYSQATLCWASSTPSTLENLFWYDWKEGRSIVNTE